MRARMPSTKTLVITCTALIATTLGIMGSGRVDENAHLGPMWVLILLGLAGAKIILILWFYLNLGQSTRGWQAGFLAFIGCILLCVWLVYIMTPTS